MNIFRKKITINARYRNVINLILWGISILSIIIAFFTVPIPIAVSISILSILFPLLVERILFRYEIVWVYPGIVDFIYNRLGFVWFYHETEKKEKIYGFQILYEKKENAKFVYSTLRSWNYNKYIGTSSNIIVSFIEEGNNKFSYFVYPGTREIRENQIKLFWEKKINKSVFEINTKVFSWVQNCADYSDRPEVLSAIESIRNNNKILINTAYMKNNIVESYAKKSILISGIKFIKREDLTEKDIEYLQKWEDPNIVVPDLVEQFSKVQL
ncbi:MAG: hypothetical protein KIC84_13090 [Dysgonomonas mossii]|uniref:hypothetical protein n=1 Tax=Dysgonomonas mossii TaxID=163665 RepID=UPI0026EB0797|nr:hypothetical protein [Dysgonomonas mossii]MBS5908150.1 hypothetical protein [Dysgonomonas mossii]